MSNFAPSVCTGRRVSFLMRIFSTKCAPTSTPHPLLLFNDTNWGCQAIFCYQCDVVKVKVNLSCYRPGVAQRVGRGIALLFHDRGTRRGVSGQQHASAALNPRKEPVPILLEAGWAPGLVWTGGKSRPHRDSIPDRPARNLYQCAMISVKLL